MSYVVCNPAAVYGFTVNKSFWRFVLKSDAANYFLAVNNRVEKICADIDEIKSDLTTLKQKMGENESMNGEIDKTIKALDAKREDFVRKNKELFAAVEDVRKYIEENQQNQYTKADTITQSIGRIDIYQG